jgi:PAS domain S-box-containing protein
LLVWPLRWVVPGSIIVLTLLLAAYSLGVELVRTERQVERGAITQLMQLMYRLQGTLQNLMQRQETAEASQLVRSLGADTTMEQALLVDENGVVLASTHLRDVGQSSEAVLVRLCCPGRPEKVASMAQQARSRVKGAVEVVDEGASVIGVYPVVFGTRVGEWRPDRVGILFIQQDLVQAKLAARRDAQQRVMQSTLVMFTLAGLLWLFFHFTVYRGVTSLVQAVQAFARGDYGKRTGFHGVAELARIAAALDRMAEDIGENQRLLTQSEQRIRLLLDSTGEGIFGIDRQGLCTFANNMAAQLLGYASSADLLGKDMHALTHSRPGDGTACQAQAGTRFEVHAGDASRHSDDEVFWRADGSRFPVEYRVRPIHSDGEIIGSVVSFDDITRRKQAEAALRAERDFGSAVLQTVGSLVVVLDRDGRIVGFNKACEQLTGYTLDEIRDKYVWDYFLPPEQIEGVRAVFSRLAAGRFPSHYQNEWLTRTRERRLIDWSNTALLDAAGEVEFVIATGIDITRRHEIEVEREKLVRELTARNAEMENFVYTISHDLKSPLITISGFSSLLEKDLQQGDQAMVRDSLGEIRKAASQMQDLIEDLLQQSRSGHLMGEPEELDLEPFLQHVVQRFDLKREQSQASISIAPHLPIIRVDKTRFAQVYQNLIDNALKYRRPDVAPVIELGGFINEAGELRLYVRDNGRGIKPAYLQRIFGLFQRADTSVEGTGVGLAIAKRIVEVHGGDMWAESQEGRGSTFWISLPPSVIVSNKATKGM